LSWDSTGLPVDGTLKVVINTLDIP
jgi:hypothetical protein